MCPNRSVNESPRCNSKESRSKSAVERIFSPEFRNRLDAIVTFKALAPEAMEMIRAQVERATLLKAAHDIIDNSGTIEATRRQVELAHRRYLDLAAQRARQF